MVTSATAPAPVKLISGAVTSPVNEKFRPVARAVAVPALPSIEPLIVLLNVLAPAIVCVPVVMIPEADAPADGIAANEIAVRFVPVRDPVGPAVVPAV